MSNIHVDLSEQTVQPGGGGGSAGGSVMGQRNQWGAGLWQDDTGNYWYLVRLGTEGPFTRAQAHGYLPMAPIADVPAT